jgi:YegS/Rv2252/BmrU family lipid kinase
MNNDYCIIYNPVSGNGESNYLVKRLKKDLDKRNIQYKIYQSKYSGDIKFLCTNKGEKNFIIIGGDGTFNEAVNGFMKRKDQRGLNNINIGFLPGGTGNAFMHDLNGETYQKAFEIILKGNTKKIDILKLSFNQLLHNNRYSLNIVGWGLASDINILSDKLRFLGGIRYNIASLYYIFNKKVRSATITIDKVITKKKYLFIMCLNTIHTGKGMKAAPNAKLDDGFFDIIIINAKISKLKLLKLLPKLFTGNHIFSKDVEYLQAKHLEINSDSIDMLNIDGENKYQTPISVDIIPKVLNIFY